MRILQSDENPIPLSRFRISAVGSALALLILCVAISQATGTAHGAEPVSGSGSLQECRAAALEQPGVKHPLHMSQAGLWPHMGFPGQQVVGGALSYRAMPEGCASRYVRTVSAELQILRGGRWTTICHDCGGWNSNDGGTGRVVFAPPHPDIPANASAYNSCDSKGRFQSVRLAVIGMLRRPATGSIEARSPKWIYPVAVQGSCREAAISTQRVERLWEREYGIPVGS